MHNKRNYYRILHVQFDAPPAVIKASYRTIMQKLRAHPDLGGEEWNAGLINEARNVLLDPILRADYDLQRRKASAAANPNSDQMHAQTDIGGRPHHDSKQWERAVDAARQAETCGSELAADTRLSQSCLSCPFCHNSVSQKPFALQEYPTAYRCTHCDAPLKNVDSHWLKKHNELRKINRSELEQLIRVWDKWPRNSGYNASVCDWSTAGCCIQMNSAVKVDTVILLLSPVFDAIATVRYQSADTFFGLEFLTLEVKMTPGSIFVSAA
ncbi:MAG: DnaJ domain-containing protein [Granulosicoccaceae bacterium]